MTDMGNIESITNRLRAERRDVAVQTSISAADADLLDEFVEFLVSNGVQSNRSGAVRALLLDGLQVYAEFRDVKRAASEKQVHETDGGVSTKGAH